MNRQSGISLPEIMIALLLASMITTALMNQYIITKRHYLHLQALWNDDIELKQTTDFIRDSIRQAGFTPCLSLDYLDTPHKPAMAAGSGLNINRMSPCFDVLLNVSSPNQIIISHRYPLRKGEAVMIADCYHAEVRRISHIIHSPGRQMLELDMPLNFTYQQPAYAGEWLQEHFYVKKSGGLFYHRLHSDELTPLVKGMSLMRQGRFVQVLLNLEGSRELVFETKVRAS